MNKKNSETVKMDIWRKFEYQGQLYYIEVFHFTDGTIQAFANKTFMSFLLPTPA